MSSRIAVLIQVFSIAAAVGIERSAANAADQPLELRRRQFLGTQLGPVSDESRQRQDLATTRGVEILQVFPNSSASASGLKVGDVLVTFGETDLDGPLTLVRKLAEAKGGDSVRFTYFRDG